MMRPREDELPIMEHEKSLHGSHNDSDMVQVDFQTKGSSVKRAAVYGHQPTKCGMKPERLAVVSLIAFVSAIVFLIVFLIVPIFYSLNHKTAASGSPQAGSEHHMDGMNMEAEHGGHGDSHGDMHEHGHEGHDMEDEGHEHKDSMAVSNSNMFAVQSLTKMCSCVSQFLNLTSSDEMRQKQNHFEMCLQSCFSGNTTDTTG